MSLSVDGVWKSGVWNTTAWADGVWREGEPVVIDVSPFLIANAAIFPALNAKTSIEPTLSGEVMINT